MPRYHLAQLNIADMQFDYEAPEMADFMAQLDIINALADNAPGFVWRLQSDDGNATEIRFFGPGTLVNLSVWENLETLKAFVYGPQHLAIMRRRREWFSRMAQSHLVLWWVPANHLPSLEESRGRLELLHEHGPSADAFTFAESFPPPGAD